jgi:WD40 repeat protein
VSAPEITLVATFTFYLYDSNMEQSSLTKPVAGDARTSASNDEEDQSTLVSRITEVIQQQIAVHISVHDEELCSLRDNMQALMQDVRNMTNLEGNDTLESVRSGDKGRVKGSGRAKATSVPSKASPERPAFVNGPEAGKKRRFSAPHRERGYHGRIVNQVAAAVNIPDNPDPEEEKHVVRNAAGKPVAKIPPTVFDAPRCADVTNAEEKERRERERIEREEATIKYDQCRTGVYRPTGFRDEDAITNQPESFLALDHIHGYHNTGVHPRTAPNMFRLPGEEVIFFTTSSVVIQNLRSRTQRSYEHDNEVSALAVHPNGRFIASGEFGMAPAIHCWDITVGRQDDSREIPKAALLCKLLGHEKNMLCLDFSHDGKLLVSMGGDHKYTTMIWMWETQQKLVTTSAHSAPVAAIRFNPFQAYGLPDNPARPGQALSTDDAVYTLTSGGVRHIKFWVLLRTEDPDGRPHRETGKKPIKWFIEGNYGNFNGTATGDGGYTQDIVSLDFVDDSPWLERLNSQTGQIITMEGTSSRTMSRVVCGTRSGDIYVFKQPIIEFNYNTGGKSKAKGPPPPWWLNKRIRDPRAIPEGLPMAKFLWDSYGTLVQSIPCSEEVGNQYNVRRDQALKSDFPSTYSGPLGHEGAVKGVAYHSVMRTVATCGEDGLLFLWNPFAGSTRTELFPVTMKDGSNVEMLITDMDGDDDITPEAIALSQHDPGFTPVQSTTVPRTLTASVYSTSILVGTSTNSIIEVDCKGSKLGKSSRIMASHSGSILALAAHPHALYYATGGRDRIVRLWGFEERDCVADVRLHRGVQDLCFHPSGRVLVVGLLHSDFIVLKIDGNLGEIKGANGASRSGKVRLVPIVRRNLLPEGKPGSNVEARQTHLRDSISRLKYSPNGRALAVGTNGRNIHIFALNIDADPALYRKVATLKGHTSVVKNLDWSLDSRFIMSNSVDDEIIYWEIAPGAGSDGAGFKPKQFVHPYELRDIEWYTWTCHLGWPVQGVWCGGHEYNDNSEINGICRSGGGDSMLTADTHCNVRLFRFPCLHGATPKTYARHCAHVTGAIFLHDDEHVVSVGGSDSTVIQWLHIPQNVNGEWKGKGSNQK